MSIGAECPHQQEPKVRLPKAVSWHHPKREYKDPLVLEKKRQELEYAILRLQLADSKSDGVKVKEKCANLRNRLNRLNSFKPARTITKTKTGFIHSPIKVSQSPNIIHKEGLFQNLGTKTSLGSDISQGT